MHKGFSFLLERELRKKLLEEGTRYGTWKDWHVLSSSSLEDSELWSRKMAKADENSINLREVRPGQ